MAAMRRTGAFSGQPSADHWVYRFWRDLGYAFGAVLAGLLEQAAGLSAAVIAGGAQALASGLLAARLITGTRSR